ncbi:MAG TPA: hypothetical protein DC054_09230 [Blastocatellia bacterium]|nr:hypothetical protein [Blastocatellia bacterium]
MGEPIQTICCVAELEPSDAQDDCNNCKDKRLETTFIWEEPVSQFYAKAYVASAGLVSYQFDDGDSQIVPQVYPASHLVHIEYHNEDSPSEIFKHLCLKYNREGKPRINVVARDMDTGQKIKPLNIPADGSDKACPIESASITASDGSVPFDFNSRFHWDDAPWTIFDDKAPGAWTFEPTESERGNMALTARADLEIDTGWGALTFHHWAKNLLSHVDEGVNPHWSGKVGDDTILLENETHTGNDIFVGIIAYYKGSSGTAGEANPGDPTTTPGPESDDQPDVEWPIFSPLVWRGCERPTILTRYVPLGERLSKS